MGPVFYSEPSFLRAHLLGLPYPHLHPYQPWMQLKSEQKGHNFQEAMMYCPCLPDLNHNQTNHVQG